MANSKLDRVTNNPNKFFYEVEQIRDTLDLLRQFLESKKKPEGVSYTSRAHIGVSSQLEYCIGTLEKYLKD